MLFFFKLIASPFFLGAAALAAKKWGDAVGGLIIGLPLISGPIAFFLAVQYGTNFAIGAAHGILLSISAQIAFAASYYFLCPKGWAVGFLSAAAAFWTAFFLCAPIQTGAVVLLIFNFAALTGALKILKASPSGTTPHPVPKYDLLIKMAVMAAVTVGITFIAPYIGPEISGGLSSFPFMACILCIFGQIFGTWESPRNTLVGLLNGLYSTTVFFFILTFALPSGVWPGFFLSIAGALATQYFRLIFMKKRK